MRRIVSLFLVVFLSFGCALSQGQAPMELYDEGMEYYYMEDYDLAAGSFRNAGNYLDAKKWAYYCEAILLAMSADSSQEELTEAMARFSLLEAQSFKDADKWVLYIKGREYEEFQKNPTSAKAQYEKILIHDSVERYLKCAGKEGLLKTKAEALSELHEVYGISSGMSAEEYYAEGMDAYYFEDYALAADCFAAAGNYLDARMWCCFSQAVSLVTEKENLADAGRLFALLSSLGFSDSADWEKYIAGRDYEEMKMYAAAIEKYKTIMVHDSSDRYMALYMIVN